MAASISNRNDSSVQIPESSREAIDDTAPETTSAPTPITSFSKDGLRLLMRPTMLYVVSVVQFLDNANGHSVAASLLPIARDLNLTTSQAVWIINAYSIVFAGLLLLSGRLGDIFGHRRVFLFGLFWFSLWSFVSSFSTSIYMFIFARVLQGMGAANTVPSAMALVAIHYPEGPTRSKAFAVFRSFAVLGSIFGALLAGLVVSSLGWPWIFRASSITALLLWPLSYFAIPLTPPKNERPKIDFTGAAMAMFGVAGVVYYMSSGFDYGWTSLETLPTFIISVFLLATFVFVETKVSDPIMPLRIWKYRTFSASVILAFAQMAMLQGIIFYTTMVMQEVFGWSVLKTALGLIIHPFLCMLIYIVMGKVMPHLRLKPLILFGTVIRCGATLLFSFADEHSSYFFFIFLPYIIHAFGVSFTTLPNQIMAIREVNNCDQGLVSAIYSTGLQLGAPFGIAILNVISIATNGNQEVAEHGNPALMKGYRNAFYGIIGFGIVSFFLALFFLPWDKPSIPAAVSRQEDEALETVGHRAPSIGDSISCGSALTIMARSEKQAISEHDTKVEISRRW